MFMFQASPGLSVDTGLAHHWAGNTEQALVSLTRAVSMSPLTMRGLDSLAALYAGNMNQSIMILL